MIVGRRLFVVEVRANGSSLTTLDAAYAELARRLEKSMPKKRLTVLDGAVVSIVSVTVK